MENNNDIEWGESMGLSKRDYFAGQALAAVPQAGKWPEMDAYDIAKAAYDIADAMFAASQEPRT